VGVHGVVHGFHVAKFIIKEFAMDFKFKFEKDLINELVVRWISDHRNDPECRKVIDTHMVAVNRGTKTDIDDYENALRIIWIIKPWQGCGIGPKLISV